MVRVFSDLGRLWWVGGVGRVGAQIAYAGGNAGPPPPPASEAGNGSPPEIQRREPPSARFDPRHETHDRPSNFLYWMVLLHSWTFLSFGTYRSVLALFCS